jgi:hypothetical protein
MFEFDASQQGRHTLRFDYEAIPALRWPAPPRSIWVAGTGSIRDYQDGLPHSCLEGYQPGTPWGEDCPVQITAEVSLSASSTYNLAEASSPAVDADAGAGTRGLVDAAGGAGWPGLAATGA